MSSLLSKELWNRRVRDNEFLGIAWGTYKVGNLAGLCFGLPVTSVYVVGKQVGAHLATGACLGRKREESLVMLVHAPCRGWVSGRERWIGRRIGPRHESHQPNSPITWTFAHSRRRRARHPYPEDHLDQAPCFQRRVTNSHRTP